jgi:hypothetical protein
MQLRTLRRTPLVSGYGGLPFWFSYNPRWSQDIRAGHRDHGHLPIQEVRSRQNLNFRYVSVSQASLYRLSPHGLGRRLPGDEDASIGLLALQSASQIPNLRHVHPSSLDGHHGTPWAPLKAVPHQLPVYSPVSPFPNVGVNAKTVTHPLLECVLVAICEKVHLVHCGGQPAHLIVKVREPLRQSRLDDLDGNLRDVDADPTPVQPFGRVDGRATPAEGV